MKALATPLRSFLIKNKDILILLFVVSLFWSPIFMNNTFFQDDWDVLRTFTAKGFSILPAFVPHNEHFTPLFNLLYQLNYKIFGMNFAAHKAVAFLAFLINVALVYRLLGLIFPKGRTAPFAATLMFATMSFTAEVVYWQMLYCFLLCQVFMLASLILLHLSISMKNRPYYWISVASSFFSLLSFSFGILTFPLITAYYYLIIKRDFNKNELKEDLVLLFPYFVVLVVFILMYLHFAYPSVSALHSGGNGLLKNPLTLTWAIIFDGFLRGTLVGILGGYNNGFTPLFRSIHVVMALCLLYLLGAGICFLTRNLKTIFDDMLPAHNRGVVLFSLFGLFLSYLLVASSRSNMGFLWGRYHYFPMLFVTISVAACSPMLRCVVQRTKWARALVPVLVVTYILVHFNIVVESTGKGYRTSVDFLNKFLPAAAEVNKDVLAGKRPALMNAFLPKFMHPRFELKELYHIYSPDFYDKIAWVSSGKSKGHAFKYIRANPGLRDLYSRYYSISGDVK